MLRHRSLEGKKRDRVSCGLKGFRGKFGLTGEICLFQVAESDDAEYTGETSSGDIC